MSRKLIDLSISIDNDVEADMPGRGPKISYTNHKESVSFMARIFKGLLPEHLPDNEGWATERVELGTHSGTHMDAPYHYHSTQDAALPGGPRPSMAIDEIPLEWCWARGVKLDFRHLPDGHVVTAAEIEAELGRIGHELRPLDIVVANTSAGAAYGKPGYLDKGCGFGRDATLYLTTRGIRVVGTDGWSWDAPFVHTAKRWSETGDPAIIWEGHKAGRDIGYCQLEKLHRLETLPATGFEIMCFPIKVRGASAGWSRVVGLLLD